MFILALAASLSFAIPASEEADFQAATGYYKLQEFSAAVEKLKKFVETYPQSKQLEEVKLLLAESQYQLKDYANAAKAFDAFVTEYPQSARRSDALQRALMSDSINKDYASCLKHAQVYVQENRAKAKTAAANDPIVIKFATALYRAGDSSYELKEFAKAQAFWEELVASLPKSPLVPDANEGLGWIYFSAKNFDKAAASFRATAETPNGKRAAWAKLMEGRALAAFVEKLDKLKAAVPAEAADELVPPTA